MVIITRSGNPPGRAPKPKQSSNLKPKPKTTAEETPKIEAKAVQPLAGSAQKAYDAHVGRHGPRQRATRANLHQKKTNSLLKFGWCRLRRASEYHRKASNPSIILTEAEFPRPNNDGFMLVSGHNTIRKRQAPSRLYVTGSLTALRPAIREPYPQIVTALRFRPASTCCFVSRNRGIHDVFMTGTVGNRRPLLQVSLELAF